MPTSTTAPIGRLTGRLQRYAWGSRTALARLQGRPVPAPGPEAELWFGAHPAAPSLLERPGGHGPVPLDRVIAADPVGELGRQLAADGPRLPFLLKILASAAPLSLQAHPDAGRARAGFAAEEAAGIPRDAPERCYRDDWPKPELFHALDPTHVLCGFRPVAATLGVLDHLDVLPEVRVRLLREGEAALGRIVRDLLATPDEQRGELVAQLRAAAQRVLDDLAGGHQTDPPAPADDHGVRSLGVVPVARALSELAAAHPRDPGVAVALLLDLLELDAGSGIHVPPGTLHAYLGGFGVEIMAASDNVLRGGLTAKHVDVDELLRILEVRVGAPPVVPLVPGVAGEVVLPAGEERFRLSRVVLGDAAAAGPPGAAAGPPGAAGAPSLDEVTLDRRGPQILLCTQGAVRACADDVEVEVTAGSAAFVAARAEQVVLRPAGSGPATVFRATPGPP